MGNHTTFTGSVSVTPPLNEHEVAYLRRFADARHMDRDLGPYYLDPEGFNSTVAPDVRDRNSPAPGQPGLWCFWEPSADGTSIGWNGAEKFRDAAKWMAYLIRTFLGPGASLATELSAPRDGRYYAPEFASFTFDHVVEGTIDAEGEEPGDVWRILVRDGQVSVAHRGGEPRPVTDTAGFSMAEFAAGKKAVRLRGGPHDGETRSVTMFSLFNGLRLPDGSVYRQDRKAVPQDQITDDGNPILHYVTT
jgi:hypothetical protein